MHIHESIEIFFHDAVIEDVTNIILDPIMIFVLHLGVRGAAIAHVVSQLAQTVTVM